MGNKQDVDCRAHYDGEITDKNPAFKDSDPGFSNQGPGSTCTRQALAKCTKFRLMSHFGYMHPIKLETMIQFLIQAVPKGMKKSSPRSYDGIKGQIYSEGYVYELKLSVKCQNLNLTKFSNLVILDMGYISEEFSNGSYHAVFLDEQTATQLICRNSFGNYMDPLILDKDSKAIHSFWAVHVKKFTLKLDDDEEFDEIRMLKYKEGLGYANIYKQHWTGYNSLRGLFDYYVDRDGNQTD